MTFDALPSTPVFPAQQLGATVELNLSGTWTDITPYVHQDPLVIGRGHPDESTTTTASAMSATLSNGDGRFSATNPSSPYYGSLIRNVPIRVSIPEGATYLRLENDDVSYVQAPDTAGLSITGDMDLQLDVTPGNWQATQILAAKWAETGSERTWILMTTPQAGLTWYFSGNGSSASAAFTPSAAVPLPPLLRQCIRVTWTEATGTATFYTAPAGNLASASWTLLGSFSLGSAQPLFDSTAPVQLGYCTDAAGVSGSAPGMYGKIHAARILSGIGGTAKGSPDFTAQTAGTTSFTDAESNTWTLHGTSEISSRKYRFHGEVPAWPQSWAPGGTDVKIGIAAGGYLRRYGRAQTALHSAFYRAVTKITGNPAPAAYWPMEDGQYATVLASGLSGGQPMVFSGTPALAADSTFLCSSALPQIGSSVLYGPVPGGVTWTDNVMRFLYYAPAGTVPNGAALCSMYTTGTIALAELVYATGGALALNGYNAAGALVINTGPVAFAVDGQQCRLGISLIHDSPSVEWIIELYANGATEGLTWSGTVTGSVGAVTKVLVNHRGANLGAAVIGHVSVEPVYESLYDVVTGGIAADGSLTGPLRAWEGETAGNRFARLCGEEGIGFRGRGNLGTSAALGVQTTETLTQLLQECADADHGAWTEPRQALGFGYRTCASIGNQTPAVALDYDQDHLEDPLQPTEDDQIIVNDITVTNMDGSSARLIQETGPLSVQAPPAGTGDYDSQLQLNLFLDTQLADEAGWNLLFGTVAEPRYPAINVNLADTTLASLYYEVLDADLGDRVQVANPPAWLPPGVIDQVIQGTSETLFTKELAEAWAGVPCTPYNVAVSDDLVYGRADTDGSTLHTGITSSATSMSGATTTSGSPLWTTTAGDFPFSVLMDGEVIEVTNITGSSSPQTFTIVRSQNGVVKSHLAGAAFALYPPPVLAMTA